MDLRDATGGAVGIMGGSFDPIHMGHLVTAEQARAELGLDEVVFIPAGAQPQKTHATPSELRYLMTVLATAANPAFSVSRLEIEREGPTYTVDTLRSVRERRPGAHLYFITGADAILSILTWKDATECLELAEFVAATRPGYDLGRLESEGLRRHVRILDVPALAISSSDVRARFESARPVRYLIPLEVEQFARKYRLYHSVDARE
jgi:nicotinate-nucleotide adenylyltransferase